MKTFGRCVSVVAAFAVAPAFRRLRTDLVSVYSAYRASLRSRIPDVLVTTLVVAEDRGFPRHAGVEFVPAVWMLSRLAAARRPGRRASLEQRLVRILTGRPPRRVGAGVRELLLASLVSRVIPKEDVAGVYLFVAYFGWRMNGIREACGRLGFAVGSLSPLQAASVVARLRYPEPPTMSDERARQIAMRARRILRLVEGLSASRTLSRRCASGEARHGVPGPSEQLEEPRPDGLPEVPKSMVGNRRDPAPAILRCHRPNRDQVRNT